NLPAAFVALLLVVLAAAVAAPPATLLLLRLAERATARALGLPGRMAARGAAASLSRTGVAVAALMVALSVTVGVSVMVGSFRGAVEEWLGDTLAADVYVTAAPLVAARNEARLPRALASRLAALPGVASVATARGVTVPGADGQPLYLLAVDGTRRPGPRLLAGDRDSALRAFREGDAVMVSESFAYARRMTVNDTLALVTGEGPRRFRVVGVFRDYG